MMASPTAFVTGMLSPVIMLSSTVEWPSTTTPSTGTFSPGRTITMSLLITSAIGMSRSWPLRTTRAVLACKPISFLIAALVCPLARTSKSLPRTISVMITADVSK